MTDDRRFIEFDCPWCGKYQSKQVYKEAETENVCPDCKKLVGIVTDENGKPIVIATKVHKSTFQSGAESEKKLDKTEADIEKAQKEAERRGAVVEYKIYGAAIEMIDRLRDQLKQQDEIANEIATLKVALEKAKKDNEDFRQAVLKSLKEAAKSGNVEGGKP